MMTTIALTPSPPATSNPGRSGGGGGDGLCNTEGCGASPYDRTIGVTTANGSSEKIVQTFTAGAVAADKTRVCLANRTLGHRAMTHNFTPPINPLATDPGQSSCANFPSNARVRFKPYTNTDPAKPAKALIYSLSRYDGGVLTLRWQ